jgi:hypothetical protein
MKTAAFLRGLVALFMAALVAQFYAAGLALFGAASFGLHAVLGYMLILTAAVIAGLSFFAGLSRSGKFLAVVILALAVLQPVLVLALRTTPVAAALHPVVGLAIFTAAAVVAREAGRPMKG